MTRLTQNEERKELMNLMGERLKALMDESCTTIGILSEATGISRPSIVNLRSGKTLPETLNIMKIADYFSVPMDFLCGRMDEETANEVLRDYSKRFMDIRRTSYECYLRKRSNDDQIMHDNKIKPAWPYNLYDEIFGYHTAEILSDDQILGLEKAISMLTEREQCIIYGHYRDEIGATDLGRKYCITYERVKQIIRNAIRKLRHPSRTHLIEEGHKPEGIAHTEINGLTDFTETTDDVLGHLTDEDVRDSLHNLFDNPVYNLDLSVRSFNGLRRNGIDTVRGVVEAIKNGSIIKIRCIGKKSYKEIVEKVEHITGKDMETLINELD